MASPVAIKRQFCSNHPDRAALGVCVITSVPICGECSTRYQGVNYSKEGLRILQQRRAAETGKTAKGGSFVNIFLWLTVPVQLYLVYVSMTLTASWLTNLLHWGQ